MTIDVTDTKNISNIFDILKYKTLNINYALRVGQLFEYDNKTYKCIARNEDHIIVKEV